MARHLQISHSVMFENKYNGMVQPTWQRTNEDIKLIKDAKRDSENNTTESDYYNSTDSIFPYKQEQTSSDYESFVDDETNFENLMLVVSEETKTYSLIEQSAQPNSLVASTRFREDIIFYLVENTKIFEVGVACLSTTIAASMLLLPEGFNTGTSLVLSAPLLVCICGILAKYAKHNS